MKQSLLVLFLIIICSVSYAQDKISSKCGISKYKRNLQTKDPELNQRLSISKNKIENWIHHNKQNKLSDQTITIPVVFHILYNKNAENISNASIYSQLDVLNEDYRKQNYDAINIPDIFKSVSADCNIEFCLAKRDPEGNPTTGIIRKETTVINFSAENDDVKFSSSGGDNIWDRDKYLNIWICNLGGGVAGYSSYPGWNPDIDGVVIYYSVFGRTDNHNSKYSEGRTVTHEVGHWLSLYHPWGDVGEQCEDGQCNCTDFCEDTPWQKAANYECPPYPHTSCSDTSDMFMNYMDYTNDLCMYMFTQDQKLRMIATLNTIRASIKISDACNPVNPPSNLDFSSDYTEIPSEKSVNFTALTDDNFQHWLWIFNGAKPDTSNLKNPKNILYNIPGKYSVTLIALNNDGNQKVSKINYIRVDTLGKADDIKIKYQYYKNDSLKYFVNSNTLTIDFGKHVFVDVKIKIYNLLGQLISSYDQNNTFLSELHSINLPLSISNNIYIIHISSQNGNIYKKLMLLH